MMQTNNGTVLFQWFKIKCGLLKTGVQILPVLGFREILLTAQIWNLFGMDL